MGSIKQIFFSLINSVLDGFNLGCKTAGILIVIYFLSKYLITL